MTTFKAYFHSEGKGSAIKKRIQKATSIFFQYFKKSAPPPMKVKEINIETLISGARRYSKEGNATGLKSLADELKSSNTCITYMSGT